MIWSSPDIAGCRNNALHSAVSPRRSTTDASAWLLRNWKRACSSSASPTVAALRIIDHAIQAFGAAGVSSDAGLARAYANIRTLRLADGPDEVHNRSIARLEYGKYAAAK